MRILKLLSAGLISVLLLSSCLGDSSTKYKYPNVFAYKDKDLFGGSQSVLRLFDGQGTQATYTGIDAQFSDGDCADLSIELTSSSSGGVMIGENVSPIKVYKKSEQASYYYRPVPSDMEEVYPSSLNLAITYADEFLGDRWVFEANTRTDEKATNVIVEFFYDPNNQVVQIYNEAGEIIDEKPCGKNQVIIDVRFFKTESDPGYGAVLGVSKDKNDHRFVANLSNLRTDIKHSGIQDLEEAEKQMYSDYYNTYVAVMFRYHQQKEADKPMIPTPIGTWETNGASRFLSFAYEKGK